MITPYTLRAVGTPAVPTIRLRPESEADRLRRAIRAHLRRLDRALCASTVREFERDMAGALEILEAAL